MQIHLCNQQQLLPVDADRMADAVRRVLAEAGFTRGAISLAVMDDAAIQPLNAQFLRHDYATDVLSFPLEQSGDRLEGEILVSAETAITNAREYGWPAEHELLLYALHGALHLAGYGDKSDEEAAAMREAEARHLRLAGVTPPTPRNNQAPEGATPR